MIPHHPQRRLAILAPGYGITPRGIESVVAELSMRLCSKWDIDIYTMGPAKVGNPSSIHVPGIRSTSQLALWYARLGHRLRRWWKLRSPIDFQSLTYSANLLPRILRQTYSAILNLSGPFGGYVCQLKRRLDGTPFIHSSQGQSIGWLELMHADQHPDYFFALTQPGYDWIRKERPALRTALVPNGVDVERYHPDVPPAAISLPRPIFLFVGALTPMKRPDLAIEAVARLERGSLVIIGDGEQRKQIVGQGTERLGDGRFLHIPFVAQVDMPAYYAACDVFTLPSPDEPFGVVFLEAMACNKPVVAHYGAVQKWLVGDGGVACDCRDVSAYATALEQTACLDWLGSPRSRACRFSWDVTSSLYMNYLERISR